MSGCSCQLAPEVDVSAAFDDKSRCMSMIRNMLRLNFERNGWSRVCLDLRKLPGLGLLDPDTRQWKAALVQLFENFSPEDGVTYRTAESGAPGVEVEPKQSLEVKRAVPSKNLLKDWEDLMHRIATRIQLLLFPSLPEDTLLSDSDCESSLDLLRLFYYEVVNDEESTTLGSSPHTDWGSFTVVWQDSVGGLETYCPSCCNWTKIPVGEDDGLAHFIVHVGDITSLSIGRVLSRKMNHSLDDNDTSGLDSECVWPSPEHRVVSPKTERRISLVYFSYPPATLSIDEITSRLDDCSNLVLQGKRAPLDRYYILRDQSGGGDTRSLEDIFEEVASTDLSTVLSRKWNQVQRAT